MDQPLVSILLSVRNAKNYIGECLDSLLLQNYSNLEIVVIDDFSTDGTYKILKNYRKQDKRIKLYRNVKKYGLRLTLNRCIKRAKGDFIAFMNQKDIATKSKIARQLKFLQDNPKIAAVGTQCHYIDNSGKSLESSSFPIGHEEIYNSLVHGISVQPESIMINKRNLPRDLLQFTSDVYPFIYRRLLVNIVKYGELANIQTKLYMHRTTPKLKGVTVVIDTIKLLIKSRAMYDYRPSFRSLFSPLMKGI